jgi:hypothetical protein
VAYCEAFIVYPAHRNKEIAIKVELRNGSPDQAVVVERGYDDLIRSLIERRESILTQQNGIKGTPHPNTGNA